MQSFPWLDSYFDFYKKNLFDENIRQQLFSFYELAVKTKENNNKFLFFGNGASAAIASHCALDFTKQAKVRSVCMSDASVLTAFSNDYGYEHWVAKSLESWADPGDVGIFISSSGRSPNIVNGINFAKEQGLQSVTFTGFANDNPVKTQGDINFWVNSSAYNIIECIHMTWICTVIDMVIGKPEYSVS